MNLCVKVMLSGKGIANPSPVAIPWTHSPVASKLGASPLKQSRHDGEFHLMELRNRFRWFAHTFALPHNFRHTQTLIYLVINPHNYYNIRNTGY